MSSEIIRAVSKKLDLYLKVQRQEDSFDLSGVNVPVLDHPKLQDITLVNTYGLHDKPLKVQFSDPVMRARLRKMGKGRVDQRVQNEYERILFKRLSRRPHSVSPSMDGSHHCQSKSKKRGPPPLIGGHPVLRMTPSPYVNPERKRIVKGAGKILSQLASCPESSSVSKSGKKLLKQKRKTRHDKSDTDYTSDLEEFIRDSIDMLKNYDESVAASRKSSVPVPIVAAQYQDFSVVNNNETQIVDEHDKSLSMAAGPHVFTYVVTVTTGDKIGASTRADVGIILYGDFGSSGWKPTLLENSQNHKRKFKQGQTDVFFLRNLPNVGTMQKVTIGHQSSADTDDWFLHGVRVRAEHLHCDWVFQCRDWLSTRCSDGKTVRTLSLSDEFIVSKYDEEKNSGVRETDEELKAMSKLSLDGSNESKESGIMSSRVSVIEHTDDDNDAKSSDSVTLTESAYRTSDSESVARVVVESNTSLQLHNDKEEDDPNSQLYQKRKEPLQYL